jgi:hypothetical protein
MDVYAETRGALLTGLIMGLSVMLAALVGGVIVLADHSPGDRFPGALVIVAGVFFGGFCLWCFRLLRHQDPYLRVDDQGIECALGRFAWRDIRRVVSVDNYEGPSSMIFVLEEGTTPQPAERTYSKRNILREPPRLTRVGLEVQYFTQALPALAEQGHVPVHTTIEELLASDAIESNSS